MRRRFTEKGSRHIEATIRVGKKGITETQIKEISKQLEARRKVKVKVLRSALLTNSVEKIAHKVASETGSKIIQIIRHTFTLYKPKSKKEK
ncbi:MAG: YhbY family RNA-binding protein [Candidatus Bathyarchaeia archaeon]